jgi:sulfur carrier protein
MTLRVNGSVETLPDKLTVAALLEARNLHRQACAVEVNRALVPKKQHATHDLRDGDEVEIVTLVGGG